MNLSYTVIHHFYFFSSPKSSKADSRAGQMVEWVDVSALKPDRRKGLTPENCPLTSICGHMHACTHIQINKC